MNGRQGRRRAPPERPPQARLALPIFLIVVALACLGFVYLDNYVRHSFDGKRWAQPARVYARPIELYAGLPLSAPELIEELDALGYRTSGDGLGSAWREGERVYLQTRGFAFEDGEERPKRAVVFFSLGRVKSIYDLEARVDIPLLRLEPLQIGGIYPNRNEDRVLLKLVDVPREVIQALLAVEDRNFYQHQGVSLRAIMRALITNLQAGTIVQGGSTITQQLVKNFWLTRERSWLRKGVEAVMAILLEIHFSKDEILEAYINEVYLGRAMNRSVHGLGLASQHYFGRGLDEISWGQIAQLVGMIKGPTLYDPIRNPKRAKARRDAVLQIFEKQGIVDAETLTRERRQGISTLRQRSLHTNPAYVDLVRRQLRRDYHERDLLAGGLNLHTHFRPALQRRLEYVVSRHLAGLKTAFPNTGMEKLQVAAVVVSAQQGEVLALLGDRNPRYAGFNRAMDAVRQIGSLVKPAVYLSALEKPNQYTLATLLRDEPFFYTGHDGQVWEPANIDQELHGEIPLYRALAHSYNLATVHLGMELGINHVARTLRRLGMDRPIPQVPAILLGAVEMSPFDVASMYQTIANSGFRSNLRAIRAVLRDKQALKGYPLRVQEVADPATMYLMRHALWRVMREGTGRAAYWRLPSDVIVAGKTGTSDDQRDCWAVGFSNNMLAVIWLGFDQATPTPLTSSHAMRIWVDFMQRAGVRSLDMKPPPKIRHAWIDPQTGARVSYPCPGAQRLPFIQGSEPQDITPCALIR